MDELFDEASYVFDPADTATLDAMCQELIADFERTLPSIDGLIAEFEADCHTSTAELEATLPSEEELFVEFDRLTADYPFKDITV